MKFVYASKNACFFFILSHFLITVISEYDLIVILRHVIQFTDQCSLLLFFFNSKSLKCKILKHLFLIYDNLFVTTFCHMGRHIFSGSTKIKKSKR